MTPAEIRAVRLRLGLSQRELAGALGVDANTVYRWEAGRREPEPYLRLALQQLRRKASRSL